MIAKKDLVDGVVYKGACRNAWYARWDAGRGVFVHWRHKFGHKFLEDIRHPEDDEVYDVFRPYEVAAEGEYEPIPVREP